MFNWDVPNRVIAANLSLHPSWWSPNSDVTLQLYKEPWITNIVAGIRQGIGQGQCTARGQIMLTSGGWPMARTGG